MTEKIAIVTGGTSGIGLCTAAALKEKGCKVYTFSRREANDPRFTHIRVDVTDEALGGYCNEIIVILQTCNQFFFALKTNILGQLDGVAHIRQVKRV